MKLILENKTHWRSSDLRRFVVRCARQEGITAARVTVTYNRAHDRGYCSGLASTGGTWSRILVPSQVVDRIDLAMVMAHEFAHNRGLRHAQMRNEPHYHRIRNYRQLYSWAETLPLRKIEPKKKERPGAAEKLARARAMLKTWDSKLKRTQTLRKKWERRVRYYEKQAARAPC